MESISLINIPEDTHWGLAVIMAVDCIAVSSNLFLLVIILQARVLRKVVSNIFLLYVLCYHILMNVEIFAYCMTVFAYHPRLQPPPPLVGKIHVSLLSGIFTSGSFSMVLITLDRFISITRPFVYRRWKMKFPMVGGILILVIAIISILHRYFKSTVKTSSSIVTFSIILSQIVLSIFNFKIYRIVKQQFAKIKSTTVAPDEETKRKVQQDLLKREMVATNICRFVVATHLLFTLPIWIHIFLILFFKSYAGQVPRIIPTLLCAFALLNSIVDPWIYIRSNRFAKEKLQKMFAKCFRKTKPDVTTSTRATNDNNNIRHA